MRRGARQQNERMEHAHLSIGYLTLSFGIEFHPFGLALDAVKTGAVKEGRHPSTRGKALMKASVWLTASLIL